MPLSTSLEDLDWPDRAGAVVTMRPGGVVEHTVDRWLAMRGSYDGALQVKPGSRGLWVSGNPAKLLTGQNLDGSDDLYALVNQIAGCLSLPLEPAELCYPVRGRLSRVDVTQSFDLGAPERVREVLRVAAITAHARHQGASTVAHQTVYLGKRSRRHSIKLYCKADELQAHPPLALPARVRKSLLEQSRGLLRIEVTVRGMQMHDDGTEDIEQWRGPEQARRQWARWWAKVELSSGIRLTSDDVLALPRGLRRTYELWARGGDCHELLGKSQYHTNRRRLLELTGGAVDINVLLPPSDVQEIATSDIGAYLRSLTPYRATGLLAEWIASTAA